MKKLILMLFLTTIATAQTDHYIYGSLGIDINQLTGWVDNPRMEEETTGLQWQLDAGVKVNWFDIHVFYGRAEFINYMIWGTGITLHPNWFNEYNFDLSIGGGLSMAHFKPNHAWNNIGSHAFRAQIDYYLNDFIAVYIRYVRQNRNDVTKGFIDEGQAGIKWIINKNW